MNFEKLRNIAVGLAVMVALAFTISTGPVSAEMKKKECSGNCADHTIEIGASFSNQGGAIALCGFRFAKTLAA